MKAETKISDPRIATAQRYIRMHLTDSLSRETLAELIGLSVSQLHRAFLAEVGESPVAYIRRLRLERAGFKLRMGAVDIGEVALAAGFGSHNAFCKAFKQHFGLSPSAFRQLDCMAATDILTRG